MRKRSRQDRKEEEDFGCVFFFAKAERPAQDLKAAKLAQAAAEQDRKEEEGDFGMCVCVFWFCREREGRRGT